MPFFHNNDKPINPRDLQAIQEMLKASLQSIIDHLEERKAYTSQGQNTEIFDPVIKIYRDGLKELPEKISASAGSRQKISMTGFIQKMYTDLAEKVVPTLDRDDESYPDIQNILISEMGGPFYPSKLIEGLDSEERDQEAFFHGEIDKFTMSDEPMEGIEDIAEYKPESGRIIALYEGRSGNSETLKTDIKELEEKVNSLQNDSDPQAYEENLRRLNDAKKAPFGLHAGAEYTRVRSSEMMAKDEITFADVYETFTNINQYVRPNDSAGGMLRGTSITAGQLKGPSATAIPQQTYQTLQTIAEAMNQIKQTKDPALQKTRAIELAAFAYQTALSLHVFSDANGRTSRLFADSILQTFGLPPHIPSAAEEDLPKTMGEGMDFKKGAEVFLDGVKKSDLELKKDPAELSQRLAKEPPKKTISQDKTSLKLSAIYEVNDETIEILRNLKQSARQAKGRFRDSEEYKNFRDSIEKSYELASSIRNHPEDGSFNLKEAEAAYSSSIRKLFKTAADYKTYKMKDHTDNPALDHNKKSLNAKDRQKMDLVNSVMEEERLITVKKPSEGKIL